MVRQTRRDLATRLAEGALAGLAAGLAMIATTLVLRVAFGMPLPVELINDRVIPLLSITQFRRITSLMGGLVKGKEVAFYSSVAVQLVAAIVGGMLFALLDRPSVDPSDRPRGRRARRRSSLVLLAVLAGTWVLAMAVLWPVLASNYRGLTPSSSTIVTAAGLALILAVYGVALAAAYGSLAGTWPTRSVEPSAATMTRRTLIVTGGAALLAVGSGGLVRSLYRRATFGSFGYDGHQTRGTMTAPVTPVDDFYVVTKNLVDPQVDASVWRLGVIGVVDRPATYSYAQLRRLPSVEQATTLECISNPVGGGLMSNGMWRGVPLRTVIEASRPGAGAAHVVFHGSDGYVHTTSMDRAMEATSLVALELNGAPLPFRHGYPARVLVPGTYGEVNVKWIDRIELVDHQVEGYYEKVGYRAQTVQTTSRFDRPRKDEAISLSSQPTIAIGGVAFAGDRGVSRVEFSTDGGAIWAPAIIDYAPSDITWAVWSTRWSPLSTGTYHLAVRATDGTGTVQPDQARGVFPSGAAGYHRITVRIDP